MKRTEILATQQSTENTSKTLYIIYVRKMYASHILTLSIGREKKMWCANEWLLFQRDEKENNEPMYVPAWMKLKHNAVLVKSTKFATTLLQTKKLRPQMFIRLIVDMYYDLNEWHIKTDIIQYLSTIFPTISITALRNFSCRLSSSFTYGTCLNKKIQIENTSQTTNDYALKRCRTVEKPASGCLRQISRLCVKT